MTCPEINNQTDLDLTAHQPLFDSFFPYSQKVMGYTKQPRLNFISDSENAGKSLGKTGYYDPSSMEITIYTDGRHIKDILRSIAHELVHHTQNCRGDFARGISTGDGYAQKDKHLRGMEREAYEKGNLCFRDWEDNYKRVYGENIMRKKEKKMETTGYTRNIARSRYQKLTETLMKPYASEKSKTLLSEATTPEQLAAITQINEAGTFTIKSETPIPGVARAGHKVLELDSYLDSISVKQLESLRHTEVSGHVKRSPEYARAVQKLCKYNLILVDQVGTLDPYYHCRCEGTGKNLKFVETTPVRIYISNILNKMRDVQSTMIEKGVTSAAYMVSLGMILAFYAKAAVAVHVGAILGTGTLSVAAAAVLGSETLIALGAWISALSGGTLLIVVISAGAIGAGGWFLSHGAEEQETMGKDLALFMDIYKQKTGAQDLNGAADYLVSLRTQLATLDPDALVAALVEFHDARMASEKEEKALAAAGAKARYLAAASEEGEKPVATPPRKFADTKEKCGVAMKNAGLPDDHLGWFAKEKQCWNMKTKTRL